MNQAASDDHRLKQAELQVRVLQIRTTSIMMAKVIGFA